MKSYEFSAKSIEKAIQNGLIELGKKQEEVDIKIVCEGGLFKKAKVVINIEEEEKFTGFIAKNESAQNVAVSVLAEKGETKKIDSKKEDLKKDSKKIMGEQKNFSKQDNEKKETKEKIVSENNEIATKDTCLKIHPIFIRLKEDEYDAKHTENNTTTKQFVEELLKIMQIDSSVSLVEKESCSFVSVESKDAGRLIGYRGECLNALQYIVNIVEQKKNENAKRVVLDIGNYKEKREENLKALAERIANKVEATGRPYKLEAMNAYERRIIHTQLQNFDTIETHSEGTEPFRHIVVTKSRT